MYHKNKELKEDVQMQRTLSQMKWIFHCVRICECDRFNRLLCWFVKTSNCTCSATG